MGAPLSSRLRMRLLAPPCMLHLARAGGSRTGSRAGSRRVAGQPMHKACYLRVAAPKCGTCGEPIEGAHVVVDGCKLHKACFVCAECGGTLQGGYARGTDGRPYCAKHVDAANRAPKPLGSLAAGVVDAARADGAAGAACAPHPTDPFIVDVRSGEKVYIESETKRKYRLGADGGKVYADEKARPVYGGGADVKPLR